MTGTERDYEAERRLRDERGSRASSPTTDDVVTDRMRKLARPDRTRSTNDQLEALSDAVSDGAPIEDAFEIEIDTGMTERIKEDPDLARLYTKIEHERTRRADAILTAMGSRPPAEQMSALEKTLRRLKIIIIAIAIPAGSSAILVGKYLYTKGAEDERASVERQHQREQLDEMTKLARDAFQAATRNAQRLDDMQHDLDRRRSPARDEDSPPPTRKP